MIQIKTIVFMDDLELHADPDSKFAYKQGSQFIEHYYKGELTELINVLVVRSMDVQPPPSKCKFCQQPKPCKCEK